MVPLQLLLGEVINQSNQLPMAVVTISIAILVIICYKLILWKSSPSSLPPGPRFLPIVGYLPFLGPNLPRQFSDMALRYGPIFKFYVGSKLNIVISTTELAMAVVREQDETFSNRNLTVATSILTSGGQDIAFSNGSYSNKLRKIFVHEVISPKNLMESSSFRRDEVREAIKNIYGKIGTAVHIQDITFLTVTKVITRMIWENSSDRDAEDNFLGAELENIGANINELIATPNLSDIFPILSWFDLQGIKRKTKAQCKKMDLVFARIIEDRIKSNSKKFDDEIVFPRRKDFLQILLELKDQKALNVTQMKALFLDLLLAGTETTTAVIIWAMTEIMRNDKVTKRVQNELAEVVGINKFVDESHLAKLEYLDATIKETMRLYPVGPLLNPRSPSKDCIIGGYTIPKGCTVYVNVWAIQRDPQNWDNPMEFNPERFLTYEGRNQCGLRGNNLKFFPFGSGRRMCPAIPMAEKMLMYLLASFLHSFNWNLPEGEKHDLSEKFTHSLQKLKPLIVVPSQRLPDASLYM